MCGFTITLKGEECHPERLSHRGLTKSSIEHGSFILDHYSLPLQTFNSSVGHQPIKIDQDNYLLFNGEIFNYDKRKFKSDLEYLIYFFQKPFDIEEYNTWDGFWSIAIVSPDKYVYMTDPLGKKQLYTRGGCLSSEIKPLLVGDVKRTESGSYFEGIEKVKPNALCCYYSFFGFHEIFKDDVFNLHTKVPRDLKKILRKAVLDRLINNLDGGVTVLLSGGLDSTIILSIICKEIRDLSKIEFLTIDNGQDGEYIFDLEAYYNIKIRRIYLEDYDLKEIVRYYENPIDHGSLIPQWILCREAKYNVIITGDGADELFSGYTRALNEDTQDYDVFKELTEYHNIRLDRMGMAFTKEIRSPFLCHNVIRYALNTPYLERVGKRNLKYIYRLDVPYLILERKKDPLRVESMRKNKEDHRDHIKTVFNQIKFI